MAWIKKWLGNVVLVAISVTFCLVLVECVLHFTPFKLKYLYPLEPSGYLHFDPALGFDITPSFATSTHSFTDLSYKVWSNRMGCYDYEYDGTSPYLYMTGDSFTWGFTPLDQKWTKRVEKETGVRALTCGVNAFGLRQEIIKTQRDLARLPQPPQLIVVGYFEGNDLGDDASFPNFVAHDGYRVTSPTHCDPQVILQTSPLVSTTTCAAAQPHYTFLQKIKFELSLHSVLYMMTQQLGVQDKIKNVLKTVFPQFATTGLLGVVWPSVDIQQDVPWQIEEQNIVAFKTLAENYGTKVVVVLIPDREVVRSSTSSLAVIDQKIKAVLDKHTVAYVDLLPAFRSEEAKKSLYWPINEHWNIPGNQFAGLLVSQYLIEHELVKVVDKQAALQNIQTQLAAF